MLINQLHQLTQHTSKYCYDGLIDRRMVQMCIRDRYHVFPSSYGHACEVFVSCFRHGIRCNAVSPGTILTPMLLNAPQENARAFIRCIAMRRVGKPEGKREVVCTT